ncbi:MAG: hypothetical protein K5751_06540 [Treponemataceae bacterium]|nr:hypothetical protein [Treponemataceae bacterium]
MAKNIDEKLTIQDAIKAFSKDDISNAGINLFSVLGYDTSLQAPLDNKTYEEFKTNYNEYSKTQIASITREVNKDTINLSIRGLHFQLSTNCRQFNSIFRVTALLHFEPIITQMYTVS